MNMCIYKHGIPGRRYKTLVMVAFSKEVNAELLGEGVRHA